MQQKGQISPEQAEILRRNITVATNNFIVAGAIIPELSNYSTFNPRQLMTPEPKLITNSEETHPEKHEATGETDDDDISDEEIEAVKKIIAKRTKKKD